MGIYGTALFSLFQIAFHTSRLEEAGIEWSRQEGSRRVRILELVLLVMARMRLFISKFFVIDFI